jgi:hypothetical protein
MKQTKWAAIGFVATGVLAQAGPLEISRQESIPDSTGALVSVTVVSADPARVRLKMLYGSC